MQYAHLGRSGVVVSRLCLGTMNFGWKTPAPPQISLYRGPILRQCDTEMEMVQEIGDTFVHELGHHVGLDDDEMPY